MNYFKILPAAASIIALSASIGFASEFREADEMAAFRILVETRDLKNSDNDIAGYALPAQSGQVYRVEIKRGNVTSVVSIDACTGIVLGNIREADKVA